LSLLVYVSYLPERNCIRVFECSLLSPEEFQEACFDDAGIDITDTLHMNVLPFLMDAKNKKNKADNRGDKEHVLSE
jgi:hypothetical protein